MPEDETKDTVTNEEEPKWLQTLMNKIDSMKPEVPEDKDPIETVKVPLIPDPIPDVPDEDEDEDEEPAPPKKSFLSWLL
ncbi:hypothetical protein D3D03_16410 [Exiguobacterium sp. RIT452]|nr:hypothetical protein D3D03_16410 [Exiguobacterium sp. RIT452]